MKLRTLALIVSAIVFAAQNSNAQNVERFVFPPFDAFAPLPPLPPIPPLPPLPPFPEITLATPFMPSPADPEVSLKQEILRVLLQNEPDRAIDLAADRLKADPADPVVMNNLSVMARSNSSKALPLIMSIAKTSTDTRSRRQAINALERISTVNVATLEDLYKSNPDSVEVRQAIVSAIGNNPDPRAAGVLANIGKNDPDVSVRRAAVRLLGRHTGPEATKALEDLLKTPPKARE